MDAFEKRATEPSVADRLARIRRSLDDPRLSLTPEEFAANLDALASRLEAGQASANTAAQG